MLPINEMNQRFHTQRSTMQTSILITRDRQHRPTFEKEKERNVSLYDCTQLGHVFSQAQLPATTNHCSGKEPTLLPRTLLGEGRPDTRERRKSGLAIFLSSLNPYLADYWKFFGGWGGKVAKMFKGKYEVAQLQFSGVWKEQCEYCLKQQVGCLCLHNIQPS